MKERERELEKDTNTALYTEEAKKIEKSRCASLVGVRVSETLHIERDVIEIQPTKRLLLFFTSKIFGVNVSLLVCLVSSRILDRKKHKTTNNQQQKKKRKTPLKIVNSGSIFDVSVGILRLLENTTNLLTLNNKI